MHIPWSKLRNALHQAHISRKKGKPSLFFEVEFQARRGDDCGKDYDCNDGDDDDDDDCADDVTLYATYKNTSSSSSAPNAIIIIIIIIVAIVSIPSRRRHLSSLASSTSVAILAQAQLADLVARQYLWLDVATWLVAPAAVTDCGDASSETGHCPRSASRTGRTARLRGKPPAGFSHILVPSLLKRAARAAAQGLVEHVALDSAGGAAHYHLRGAAIAARDVVGSARMDAALQLNRRCGRAKRLVTSNYGANLPMESVAESTRTFVDDEDPLFVLDPWAAALRRPSCAPGRSSRLRTVFLLLVVGGCFVRRRFAHGGGEVLLGHQEPAGIVCQCPGGGFRCCASPSASALCGVA